MLHSRLGAVQMVAGVRGLAGVKSVWLLDQFGVLHDGVTAYPAAVGPVALRVA
jgi:hypothetical protein